ncbi:MAG: uroporphyrinogen decarboxylase [Magnetococcales bacterium]|nr:uroporphyrinogen decarboxylase [Magnetococcales bacterium]
MEPKHPFIRSCLRLPVEQTPLWLMRQAGRYLPEYRKLRAQAGDFMSLCQNPELATEITIQPIRRFDLDAAILFSDILVIPHAMGMGLHFVTGEGPILADPMRQSGDIDRLKVVDPNVELKYVMDAIAGITRELAGRVPLIGFSGSPWTVATYMVEGGSSKTFSRIKGMLYDQPKTLHKLLDRLVDSVADYLNAQIEAGVSTVQIFDSWGGALGPKEFREFSLNPMARIVERLHRTNSKGEKVPVILFAKGCGQMLEELADTGCDVLGLDWTTDLGEARKRVGDRVALQGNMDPTVLYAQPARIDAEVERLLTAFGSHPGHVFNLGHGMSPDMNPDHVTALVESVHGISRRIRGAS